jgi:LytS/YehU family sensor histidine kinase
MGNIYGKSITPMIFIPFIENAFKHSDKKNGNPGIIINLVIKESKLNLNVTNQLQSNGTMNKDQTGGIGLVNVRRRLELIHPNEHTLDISKTDREFKVSLELPLV